ncbi:MAG TPA: FtsX-like permease family protein [Candidatus Baltobacteraceae bacterium]|nr:FtsX-like permease family protein [Candidatus Baltobacteraceae bacterium]
MFVLQSIRIALRALRVNKLRSGLTMLGIVIGVGAVIAMVAVGTGASARIQEQIARLQPYRDNDFDVRNLAEMFAVQAASTKTMTILLGAIASVSLLVGGIGITNIMLVSVAERTREIGLRMAVGARSRDILCQFLIEAVTLALVGGILGIALGVGGSALIALLAQRSTLITPGSIAIAFDSSAFIGIFF